MCVEKLAPRVTCDPHSLVHHRAGLDEVERIQVLRVVVYFSSCSVEDDTCRTSRYTNRPALGEWSGNKVVEYGPQP